MAMSLLERYDEMQRRPFGTNTALSDGSQYGVGGTAGSQFRRQEQAYGRALRLLDRQARRGDVKSALTAIDVRNKAMESGYTPGGIRRKAEADRGLMGRVESEARLDEAQRMKAESEKRQAGILEQMADETLEGQRPAESDAPGTFETPDDASLDRGVVNPNATAGAGRGTPLGRKRPGLESRWDAYRNRMA